LPYARLPRRRKARLGLLSVVSELFSKPSAVVIPLLRVFWIVLLDQPEPTYYGNVALAT
jgi:hypothetical protein